jgi:uncharacterized membrane protein HdeD (DUF308 family)
MNDFPWIIAVIIIGLVLLGIIVAFMFTKRQKSKPRANHYRTLFILGITFLPLGILYEIVFFVSGTIVFLVLGLAFVGMGLPYLVIGLANRDKWQNNQS